MLTSVKKLVPLRDSITYRMPNLETGGERVVRCAPGHLVLVDAVTDGFVYFVDGIAAPTMHGGGVHTKATDPQTGHRLPSVIVNGVYVRH